MGVCWLLVSYENNGVETTLCSITKNVFFIVSPPLLRQRIKKKQQKTKKKLFTTLILSFQISIWQKLNFLSWNNVVVVVILCTNNGN